MNQRIFQVAVLTLVLPTLVSLGFSQTSSELKNFLSQRLGLTRIRSRPSSTDSHLPKTRSLAYAKDVVEHQNR